jgi:cell division protein FtsQ
MFFLVIFLFSFTSKRNENRKLKGIEILFVEETSPFVKQEAVNKLLIENNGDVKSIQKLALDLSSLEHTLNSQKMIKQSDVFVTIDGVLKAVIKQRTPIARIFVGERSFYIDYEGNKMPLSNNFTARVPLVSGAIESVNNEDLIAALKMIYEDDFLKKNIIGMEIMPNASLKMYNRNFDYRIDFGNLKNAATKFKNYKAFFQKAVLDNSLEKYKKIDLRFTDQVVCTK